MTKKLDKLDPLDKLDAELARAAAADDDDDGAALVTARPAEPRRTASSSGAPTRSVGLLIALLVAVGALASLFFFGVKSAAIYAMPVTDLVQQTEKLSGRRVRVEGELVPGTLVKRDQPCEYRFTMRDETKTQKLDVRYAQCVVPDTFRDMPGGGVQVTVEGKLEQAGHFEASLVMAKCTSKYDPATHQMSGAPSSAPQTETPGELIR